MDLSRWAPRTFYWALALNVLLLIVGSWVVLLATAGFVAWAWQATPASCRRPRTWATVAAATVALVLVGGLAVGLVARPAR
jgi:hypothetical protein